MVSGGGPGGREALVAAGGDAGDFGAVGVHDVDHWVAAAFGNEEDALFGRAAGDQQAEAEEGDDDEVFSGHGAGGSLLRRRVRAIK